MSREREPSVQARNVYFCFLPPRSDWYHHFPLSPKNILAIVEHIALRCKCVSCLLLLMSLEFWDLQWILLLFFRRIFDVFLFLLERHLDELFWSQNRKLPTTVWLWFIYVNQRWFPEVSNGRSTAGLKYQARGAANTSEYNGVENSGGVWGTTWCVWQMDEHFLPKMMCFWRYCTAYNGDMRGYEEKHVLECFR